jgi:hypothetical protein
MVMALSKTLFFSTLKTSRPHLNLHLLGVLLKLRLHPSTPIHPKPLPPWYLEKHPDLTWNDRAIAVFILVHPSIYGLHSPVTRIDNTAKAIGASSNTVRQWASLTDKGSHANIQKWYGIVKHMEWGTVKNDSCMSGYANLPSTMTPMFATVSSHRRDVANCVFDEALWG